MSNNINIYKDLNINKDLISLFDPLEWEIKIKNFNNFIKQQNKTQEQILRNPELNSFIESIEKNLRDKHATMLLKIDDERQKANLESEFLKTLKENIFNKYNQLNELLSNGSKKLEQKQNANKYLTDIIDRDENIKLACMQSLVFIYKGFFHSSILKKLIRHLHDEQVPQLNKTDQFNKGVEIVCTLKRINPRTQKEEFVFSYTHTLL